MQKTPWKIPRSFLYILIVLKKNNFMENIFWICILIFFTNLFLLSAMIIHQRKKPQYILIWTLLIVLFPIFGFFAYCFYGLSLNKKIKKTLKQKKQVVDSYFTEKPCNCDNNFLQNQVELQNFVKNIGGSDVCNCKIDIFCNSKNKIKSLKNDIKNAKKSINITYYIFQNDKIGREIMFLLCQKAKQGLDVNLIYDGVGSKKTPKKYFEKLEKCGGTVKEFFPPIFGIDFLNPQYNFRNHRKIVVIDECIGYFGGMNICLDSTNGKQIKPWKDIHYRLRGDAVLYLQKVFYSDFVFLGGKVKLSEGAKTQICASQFVQLFSSGPEERLEKSKDAIVKMIYMAKKKVYLQTPYFVPDSTLIQALKTASLSGVEVCIMMPQKQDKKILQIVGLYYASHLCDMGIKFFLYEGFLHSKLLIIDDIAAFGGSSNFDNRSFSLNFEINGVFYDKKTIKNLLTIWNNDLRHSHALTKQILQKEKSYKTSTSVLAQILSPFL